jgi:hypothetical protein
MVLNRYGYPKPFLLHRTDTKEHFPSSNYSIHLRTFVTPTKHVRARTHTQIDTDKHRYTHTPVHTHTGTHTHRYSDHCPCTDELARIVLMVCQLPRASSTSKSINVQEHRLPTSKDKSINFQEHRLPISKDSPHGVSTSKSPVAVK